MSQRHVLSALAVIAAAAASAGCTASTSGSGSGSPPAVARSSAASASTSASVSTPGPVASSTRSSASAASSAAAPTPSAVPQCTDDIRVIPGAAQGAAGHRSLVLVFNNVSRTTTCELTGYPGVDLVTSSGATVAHLVRTLRGMAGGEPAGVSAPAPVVLAPGASASALAEASDVPQGGITDCGSYSLLITVPNQYVSVPGGTASLPRCAAEIHPVVAGTTGGMN